MSQAGDLGRSAPGNVQMYQSPMSQLRSMGSHPPHETGPLDHYRDNRVGYHSREPIYPVASLFSSGQAYPMPMGSHQTVYSPSHFNYAGEAPISRGHGPNHHRTPSDGFLQTSHSTITPMTHFGGAAFHNADLEYSMDHIDPPGSVCRYFLNDSCIRGDRCKYLHTQGDPQQDERQREKMRRPSHPPPKQQTGRRGRGTSLIEPKRPSIDGKLSTINPFPALMMSSFTIQSH